jgi:hypothetical protein
MRGVLVIFTGLLMCSVTAAQAFPQAILSCASGKQEVGVELGEALSDGKGGLIRKTGSVGIRWGQGGKALWAKAEKQVPGYRVTFPGRKTLVVVQTRQLKDDTDTAPYITLVEEGGKTYQCSQEIS